MNSCVQAQTIMLPSSKDLAFLKKSSLVHGAAEIASQYGGRGPFEFDVTITGMKRTSSERYLCGRGEV